MSYLRNTRLRIEKYVYENGINVALDNIEKSKPYQKIQKDIKKALDDQISFIAADEKSLDTLIMLAKVSGGPLYSQVSILLSKVPINEKIELAVYLIYAGEEGGQAALDKIGIDATFGLKNQQVIDYFADYSNLILDSVDTTTKKWVATKIQEGKDKGLSPFEIQKTLIDDSKGINALRAERIVLTETAKAMTTVELETAKRLGAIAKAWHTSRDDRVDPICLDLEGDVVPMNKSFMGGYDGPPAHVSCRCYLSEIYPDDWTEPDNFWTGE